jgi:hypothetical protein
MDGAKLEKFIEGIIYDVNATKSGGKRFLEILSVKKPNR